MAAAQLVNISTDGDTSDDVVITDTPLTVALNADAGKPIPGSAVVTIQAKDTNGAYWTVATLNGNTPGLQITGPGTYRLAKASSALPYGAFSA